MYQVTIKGRNLEELKEAVRDINNELNSRGAKVVVGMEKDLEVPEAIINKPIAPAMNQTMLDDAKKTLEGNINAPTPIINGSVFDGEVDSEGLPWSEELHAKTKTKVADGSWTKKRGLDKEVFAKGKLELREKMQLMTNPPVVPAAPINEATPVVEAPKVVGELSPSPVVTPVVELPKKAAPVVPVAIVGNGHTLETFMVNFPMILGSLISEGKVKQEYVNQLKEYFQVSEIWEVSDEQKAEMFESFSQYGFITKVG